MSQLQTLLESSSPWKSQQSEAAALSSKWGKSGLLEGLKGFDKSNMSMLLENQAKELIVEASQTGGGNSGFVTGDAPAGQWAGIALPMVRKIFGQVVAKEFVSVQPMQMPTGLIFYLDFQYGRNKAPFEAGDSIYGDRAAGFGDSNFDNKAEGGFYGAGRFGYSRNEFSASGVAISASLATAADVNFNGELTASLAAGELIKVFVNHDSMSAVTPFADGAAYLAAIDKDAISAFVVETGSVKANGNLQEFTTVDSTKTTFIVSASAGFAPTDGEVYYYKKGSINPFNTGDYEDGNTLATDNVLAANIEFPEMNIELVSDSITAETRKLKAQWTPEFAQDLNAYQNLDAEAELTSMLSEQISMEIDLEILGMLTQGAAADNTEFWSAKVGNVWNGTAFASETAGVYYNQMSWFQTLGIKLQKISNKIHQKTLRGGANFMVVSPAVATILESIPGFAADNTDAETMKYAFGVQKIGAINGRYKVYKNPYFTTNTILLGYKGGQFLETGAVYAPYVPLIMTPLIYDPTTFTPRKGVMTRYAKKMLRPDYYGKIHVANMDIV